MSSSISLAQPRGKSELSDHVYARSKEYVLYRGDSLELMDQFEDQTFDLIFADPPYFLSNGGFTCAGGKRAPVKKGGWDKSNGIENDHAFTTAWLQKCQRLLKPSGTIWVSGTQHVIFSVGFAMQQLGYKLLNTVTWYKPNASPNLACRYFTHSTEILIWASPGAKGKLQHKFNYKDMKAVTGKQMRDVWALPKTGEEELGDEGGGHIWNMTTAKPSEKTHGKHPTQKPIALLERIVDACTEDDSLVLDPFCGSGTTGVAAVSKGRRFVGLDMDTNYLDLTKKRLDALR
ncbi:MAG: site-specific DNA-methyltransferase [Archangium gephyra]|uniref:Methyltransferase n=1 Tax=Archangium gephyra TaxID=48 RepID=A0A2W5W2E1_9BACT|nr:MAG: site-specific DNA-methyltransferase [Archangium gephyra]